MHKLVSSRTS